MSQEKAILARYRMSEIILGLIQGITEWLPVSSSGHLVIYQEFFNTGTPLIVDIMLHLATLIVIFLVFYKEIFKIILAFLRFDFKSPSGRLGMYMVIGSIPTAIIGLAFESVFEALFSSLAAVGFALIINGLVLLTTAKMKGRKKLTPVNVFFIGIAQGLAIVPGISRSGITISAGLFQGIERNTAATFSFLLSVPAIIGAALFKIRDLSSTDINIAPLIIGMIVSVIVGYAALKLLLKIIQKKQIHYFAPYCLILGVFILSQTI